MPTPTQMIAAPNRSDPLMRAAVCAGLTIGDCLNIGLSPLVFECNEAWKPLLAKMCDRFGYCWEWVPKEVDPATEYYAPWGEVVMTKV